MAATRRVEKSRPVSRLLIARTFRCRPREGGDPYAVDSRFAAEYGSRLSPRSDLGSAGTTTACSLRGLAQASACDVEEDLLQRRASVTREQAHGRVVVLDAAELHDDDALAQAFDLAHIVRGEQHARRIVGAVAFQPRAHPVGGVGVE